MHLLVRPKPTHLFHIDNINSNNYSSKTLSSSSLEFDDTNTNKLSILSNIATGSTSSDIINRNLNIKDNSNDTKEKLSLKRVLDEDTSESVANFTIERFDSNNTTASATPATEGSSKNENSNKTNSNNFNNNDRDAQALTNLLLGLNAGVNSKGVPSMSSIQFLVGPPGGGATTASSLSPLSQLSHLAPPNLMGGLGAFNPQLIQPPLPSISASSVSNNGINLTGGNNNSSSGIPTASMPPKIKKSRTHWRPEDILMVKNLLVKYDGLIGSVAHHMEVHHPAIVASHTRGSVRKKIRFLRHELQKKGYFKNSNTRDKLHRIQDESPLLHEHRNFDDDEDDLFMDQDSSNDELTSSNSPSIASASPRTYATDSPVPVGNRLSKEDLRIVSTLNNLNTTEVAEKELGLNLSPWVVDLPNKYLVVWPLPKRDDTQISFYVKNNTVFINYKVKPPSSEDAVELQKLLGLDSPISFSNNEQIYVGKYTIPSDVIPNTAKIHYHSHYSVIELEKLLPFKIVDDNNHNSHNNHTNHTNNHNNDNNSSNTAKK